MSSQILNHSRAQLLVLEQEYHVPASARKKSEVCNRMKSCLSKAVIDLEKAAARAPITQMDIIELHSFKDDLQGIRERIGALSVKELEDQIDRVILSGADRALYRSKPVLKEKIEFLLERFKDAFVGMIRTRIHKQMYYAWNQKLRFQSSLKEIVDLNESIAGLKAKQAKRPDNKKLTSQISAKEAVLAKKESFVKEYEKGLAAAASMRKDLAAIGGAHVSIETKDHVQLDGVYLSAQQFGETCRKAGAKLSTLKLAQEEGELTIHGLVLHESETGAAALIETLNRLKIFKDFSADSKQKGNGWAKVANGDKTYIVPDYELQAMLDSGHVNATAEGQYQFNDGTGIQEEENDLALDAQNSGTIILGMGAAGVYEMYKREALAFLMQGMNVMLYNQRGHGESSGAPSENGTYEDLDAVYSYLKDTHGVKDEKLVVRGLCLSGGIAANLAAKHPKINLILDQTYADVADISLNTVLEAVKDILQFEPEETNIVKLTILRLLTPILRKVVEMTTPGYSVVRHLKSIEGKILVLRTLEDTYVPKNMTDKILETYASKASYATMRDQLRIGHMPGIHGATWLDAKTEMGEESSAYLGRHHIYSFLNEIELLNPFIDKADIVKSHAKEYTNYLAHVTDSKAIIQEVFDRLPEDYQAANGLENVALDDIEREAARAAGTEGAQLQGVIDGTHSFANVLADLDRLKDRMGGSQAFTGEPVINAVDSQKTFFGIPQASVQDWFRMVIKKQWKPAIFWSKAATLFDVREDNALSQYEDVHLRVQRYGMLLANKERFFDILARSDSGRYIELNYITGMMWHPGMNGPATERLYIEFIETFLTTHYEAAKAKGDDALIEYFNAFSGVCFEDRARQLEAYVRDHVEGNEDIAEAVNAADWSTSQPVDRAFAEELRLMTGEIGEVDPMQFLERLRDKGIFEVSFAVEGGSAKPTLKKFHAWVLEMVELCTMAPYTVDDFVGMEISIMREEGLAVDEASVMTRLEACDGQNGGEFVAAAPETLVAVQRLV